MRHQQVKYNTDDKFWENGGYMTDKQRIMIVDDDANIAELVSLYLMKECFDTEIVPDGETAVEKYGSYKPDLILLDIMLPGIDGYEVLRRIRKFGDCSVIMLSAKGETFYKVLGLELGADDYMVKPFDSKELVARVKAVLRRNKTAEKPAEEPEDKDCVKYPDLIISLTNYQVTYMGHVVDMPPKELELLYFLASHPNQVFSRDKLLELIWDYDYVGDSRTIDVHIKRLREKIHDHDNWAIGTVWGRGYRFETR